MNSHVAKFTKGTAGARRGFTLIELIVVVGIIAVLATIVIVAVNPARQLAQSRQSKRRSDTTQILNAIHQYAADNLGTLPGTIPTTATNICDSVSGGTCGVNYNLGTYLVPTYISAIPTDPGGPSLTTGTASDTRYSVARNATSGRVTVAAPNAALETVASTTISVTR